jgi:hypothetical protein
MKCLLGKLRTRVSVFSDGGMVGGQAIDTLVETWAGMESNWGIDARERLVLSGFYNISEGYRIFRFLSNRNSPSADLPTYSDQLCFINVIITSFALQYV